VEQNLLSAGLLKKGIVTGTPLEMGIVGKKCSTLVEGETSGTTEDGREGGLSTGRRVVFRYGESNLSHSKPSIGMEEGS